MHCIFQVFELQLQYIYVIDIYIECEVRTGGYYTVEFFSRLFMDRAEGDVLSADASAHPSTSLLVGASTELKKWTKKRLNQKRLS